MTVDELKKELHMQTMHVRVEAIALEVLRSLYDIAGRKGASIRISRKLNENEESEIISDLQKRLCEWGYVIK